MSNGNNMIELEYFLFTSDNVPDRKKEKLDISMSRQYNKSLKFNINNSFLWRLLGKSKHKSLKVIYIDCNCFLYYVPLNLFIIIINRFIYILFIAIFKL